MRFTSRKAYNARVVLFGPSTTISATTSTLGGEAGFDAESMGECNYPYVTYPFKEYYMQEAKYLQQVALLHRNHMYFCHSGLVATKNFMPETVDDVYYNNAYCMSWF